MAAAAGSYIDRVTDVSDSEAEARPLIDAATPLALMLVVLRAAVVTVLTVGAVILVAIPVAIVIDGLIFDFGESSDDRQGMAAMIVMSGSVVVGLLAGVRMAWVHLGKRVDWASAPPRWFVLPAASLWLLCGPVLVYAIMTAEGDAGLSVALMAAVGGLALLLALISTASLGGRVLVATLMIVLVSAAGIYIVGWRSDQSNNELQERLVRLDVAPGLIDADLLGEVLPGWQIVELQAMSGAIALQAANGTDVDLVFRRLNYFGSWEDVSYLADGSSVVERECPDQSTRLTRVEVQTRTVLMPFDCDRPGVTNDEIQELLDVVEPVSIKTWIAATRS